jgi:tellurite resistance protein
MWFRSIRNRARRAYLRVSTPYGCATVRAMAVLAAMDGRVSPEEVEIFRQVFETTPFIQNAFGVMRESAFQMFAEEARDARQFLQDDILDMKVQERKDELSRYQSHAEEIMEALNAIAAVGTPGNQTERRVLEAFAVALGLK